MSAYLDLVSNSESLVGPERGKETKRIARTCSYWPLAQKILQEEKYRIWYALNSKHYFSQIFPCRIHVRSLDPKNALPKHGISRTKRRIPSISGSNDSLRSIDQAPAFHIIILLSHTKENEK
jgi:hypothetical protein